MIFDLIKSTAFSVCEVFRPLSAVEGDLLADGGFPRRFLCADSAFDFFT